jgi:hypothetical protein
LDAQSGQNQGTGRFELTVSSQSEAQSRMVLGNDGVTTAWKPGDQLVLVDKSGAKSPIYLDCTLEEGTASKATFVSESGVPAGAYWVIYNYNENLVYGNKTFESISDVNANDDLVLYAELNVVEGTSSASIEMKHLYALIRVVLKNLPNPNSYHDCYVGMYSTQKGLSKYKQFTSSGLVNADYGYTYSMSYGYTENYHPSDEKIHNMFLGYYQVGTNGYYDSEKDQWIEYDTQTESEGKVALVLPEDLSAEEVFFYVIGDNKCYEFKKSIGKVNLKAGTNYKVVLDFNDSENMTETTLQTSNNNSIGTIYSINSPEEWRHAAYRSSFEYFPSFSIDENIDFEGKYFFPISAAYILGNNHTLSNITLNRENESNVGLYRFDNQCLYGWYWDDIRCSISDLTLENAQIIGKDYVGAFGGCNVNATNCKLIGNSGIKGNGYFVGGITGWCNLSNYVTNNYEQSCARISNCTVGQNCSVSGLYYVGGIVGAYDDCRGDLWWYTSSRLITGCTSSATVKGDDYVGGIFGKLGGSVERQESLTSLYFSMDDYTLTLSGCKNYGSVSGNNYVGGIGGDFAVTSNNSYDSSDGTSRERVVLNRSLSEGTVTGNKYVGGILGSTIGFVNTCYSIGTIEAKDSEVGGIVGSHNEGYYQSAISNCYSLADIKAGANGYAGGIMGRGSYVTIKNSYYAREDMLPDGILGCSDGYCTIENCLTATSSLSTNLISRAITDSWGNIIYPADVVTNSFTSVESILDNKSIINGDNAYSDNIWTNYPYECVKFDSFSAEVENPDLNSDTIY